jgi:hypothetical protein
MVDPDTNNLLTICPDASSTTSFGCVSSLAKEDRSQQNDMELLAFVAQAVKEMTEGQSTE